MEIREILALNLKRRRKAAGFSQEELVHRIGIDRTYVSSLKRKVYAESVDLVDRLARALDMQAADLLEPPKSED